VFCIGGGPPLATVPQNGAPEAEEDTVTGRMRRMRMKKIRVILEKRE